MSDVKQVKVDNWGIFFLQRLQQFFNRTDYCDLTLQFENNVQLKVHRLVINACTEYFQLLESTCDVIDNCLMMPIDLQPDVVVPIINFMYTGQLEFVMSNYDKLYSAAKLMKMTVLTKLLDAQKVPVRPVAVPKNKRYTIGPVTWNLQGKKIVTKPPVEPDLPETIPGRKLPIWKRRKIPPSQPRNEGGTPIKNIPEIISTVHKTVSSKQVDNTPRPTRFEWHGDDLPQVSCFDDISYHSEPLTSNSTPSKPVETNSSAVFEEIKRTASTLKRPLPTNEIPSDKTINLKEVKEFLEEQRVRNDYILKNDLSQNEDDEVVETSGSEMILGIKDDKNDGVKIITDVPLTKKVKFNIEGKENTKTIEAKVTSSDNINDHTSLIAEVLKKYPHLMQKNKNIKLKIIKRNCESVPKGSKFNYTIKEELNKDEVCIIVDQEVQEIEAVTEPQVKSDANFTSDFYCRECSDSVNLVQFKTYPDFIEHVTEYHPNTPATRICPCCGFQALNDTALIHHVYSKHEIELPGFKRKRFPRCKKCNYAAMNTIQLKIHINQHSYNTTCPDCKETSNNYIEFIKHSYNLKHNQSMQFNCPFCVKKFIRTISLYNHMRTHHPNEYLEEEFEVNPTKALEPISHSQDNENILSTSTEENVSGDLDIRSVPSSEAEALTNVASGIAASLGLVDTIVVLDNQEYVLQHDDQKTQQIVISTNGDEEEAQETIESQPADSVTISTTEIENNSTMTSTDELVMVLTDHTYNNETNPIINPENSNIVVLYSHPIENQGEFISQPNDIILNHSGSEIIELNESEKSHESVEPQLERSTDESQDSTDTKSQSETIELIQEEVNKHLTKTDEDQSKIENIDLSQAEPMEVDEPEPEPKVEPEENIVIEPKEEINETSEPDKEEVVEPAEDVVSVKDETELNLVEAMEVDGPIKINDEHEAEDKPTEKNLEVISSSSSDECILLPDETPPEPEHSEDNKESDATKDQQTDATIVENSISQDEKNNVTDLVSDWCDDDSGQPNSCDNKKQDDSVVSLVEEKKETSESPQEAAAPPSSQSIVKSDDCGTKEEKPNNENVKINKLLDDWDDVDTDSQKSNEPTQSSIKSPITNLIDDWADDE